MKLKISVILALCACIRVQSQPWMPKGVAGPLKFADARARYQHETEEDQPLNVKGGEEREGKDHLFQKWEWYWQQHLDKDGYMVPPVRTTEAWLKYTGLHHQGARTTSLTSNWVFQGPHLSGGGYAGIGRLNVVAFDPVDSNTFYVGSAAGSTWKTTNGGASWTSLYDFLPTLGVADIKINPRNRNTVYVATGDGDAGDAYSSGVIKSYNGGLTWSITGLSWMPTAYHNARSLLINPLDTNTLILGTNNGIYKSHDGGATWVNIPAGDFKQILYKPNDTNVIYGSIYTSTSAQIVRSTDAGNTWTTVTSFADAQRINLAVCPSSPATVKAIASNPSSGLQGIYSSGNSGLTFSALFTDDTSCTNNLLNWDLGLPTTGCGGQGWYDLCIAINPANVNEVTVGGVNTYYSNDGGTSWQIVNTWWGGLTGISTVHADKHFLGYNPLTGGLFETCDGGVYKNYGPLTAPWTDLSSGICVTEFYRNAVANGATFCIGGAQDNGTKMVNAGTSTDLTGGDGMQPLVNFGDPNNIFYCSFQNGAIDMTRDAGAHYHSITDTLHSSGAWVTPYVMHPIDTATIFLGYKNVFITHDNGISWRAMSPVFDSNSNIEILQVAHSNGNYLYAVHPDYNIWKSVLHYTNCFGLYWDTIHVPFNNFISDLAIDPRDENIIHVTVSGYGPDKVWGYNLATGIWNNESGTLPDLPVNCVLIDSATHTLYVGTDAAVFYKDTTMTDWALFNTHLPTVHVTDLNINYTTGDLWAATFGRGMWKTRKADFPPALGVRAVEKNLLHLYPNPAHGMVSLSTNNSELVNTEVTVKMLSADGRTELITKGLFDGGGNLLVGIEGLSPGFYICEVSNGATTDRAKVIVY